MKYIMRVFFTKAIILLSIIGNCQSGIKILPVDLPASLKWSYDSLFSIKLNLTNYTDSTIAMPVTSYAYDKDRMGPMEIGVQMKLNGKQVQKYCAPSVQYLVFPNDLSIDPNETKAITVQFRGDCFVRKGLYKIKFYLMVPVNKKGKKYYKKFSSEKFEVSLI